MLGYLRKLIDHLEWADATALEALRNSPGSESARALTLYAHVLGAEARWLARLAGRAPDVAVWPTLSLDEAAALAAGNARELNWLASTLTPGDLTREIAYQNSNGESFRNTMEDILIHVALHGSYHRGQVALVIRAGGGEPASTDYIGFIRGVPTARTVPPIPVV